MSLAQMFVEHLIVEDPSVQEDVSFEELARRHVL